MNSDSNLYPTLNEHTNSIAYTSPNTTNQNVPPIYSDSRVHYQQQNVNPTQPSATPTNFTSYEPLPAPSTMPYNPHNSNVKSNSDDPDEEHQTEYSHSESLSREWRAMDRVLKKADRAVTRFEHAMERKNKTAALQSKEAVQKELKILTEKYPKDGRFLIQRIGSAMEYFNGQFQNDLRQADLEREQTLAGYRNAVVAVKQDAEETNQALNDLLRNENLNQ